MLGEIFTQININLAYSYAKHKTVDVECHIKSSYSNLNPSSHESIFADIDGLADMRLIYGIIVVEERDKRVKEGKVCLLVYLHNCISSTTFIHKKLVMTIND